MVAESSQFDFKKSFQNLKPETFWQFLKEYPDWEAGSVYVYRLWPVIDRQLAGHKEKNIDIFTSPITDLDILHRHGSGKYQLRFNDSNKPKGLVNVATCKADINDPLYEPVVPLEEIVEGADANKSFIEGLKARGKWKESAVLTNDGGQATAEMARTLNNIVDKVMERSPAQTEKPTQDPFDIALRMIQLVPKPGPVPDPMDQALRLMEFVRANQKSQAVDPLDAYAKVAEVIETRASRQTANPGGGTDWGALILGFVNALPQMVQGFMMMRAMAPPPPAANPGFQNPPVPLAPGPNDSTGVDMPIQPPDLNSLFNELKPFLVKAIVQGQAGDEFAAGLVTFQGEARYRQLASYGMDGLMGALKSNAELWMMLSSYEDQVRTFIQDFLDYGKEEPAALEGAVE
ncbi:MAG: hypothetical protein A2107_07550 [Verrucomicrobia bacterium GWF2_62_7]|nr:MAG: hypothetical protein A2107_07550 [Verrucomicrobia bacterium GWF2_62_7]